MARPADDEGAGSSSPTCATSRRSGRCASRRAGRRTPWSSSPRSAGAAWVRARRRAADMLPCPPPRRRRRRRRRWRRGWRRPARSCARVNLAASLAAASAYGQRPSCFRDAANAATAASAAARRHARRRPSHARAHRRRRAAMRVANQPHAAAPWRRAGTVTTTGTTPSVDGLASIPCCSSATPSSPAANSCRRGDRARARRDGLAERRRARVAGRRALGPSAGAGCSGLTRGAGAGTRGAGGVTPWRQRRRRSRDRRGRRRRSRASPPGGRPRRADESWA